MEISVDIFDKICRVCLIQSPSLKSLFSLLEDEGRNLCDILSFTANVNVKYEDNLPKQVCNECKSIMLKADAFKRRCLESEVLLNNVYANHKKIFPYCKTVQENHVKLEKMEMEERFSGYINLGTSNATTSSYQVQGINKNTDVKTSLTVDAVFSKETKNLPFDYNQVEKNNLEHNFDDNIDFSMDNLHDNESIDSIPIEFEPKNPIKDEENTHCECGQVFDNKDSYQTHLKEKSCTKHKKKTKKNKNVIKVQDIIILNNKSKRKRITNEITTTQNNHNQDDSNKPKKCFRKLKIITEEELKPYQCSLCFRKFKSKAALETHIQKHRQTENVKHICEICKREFKYKAYLENHIVQTHTKVNRNTCKLCGMSFVDQLSLDKHKESHNDDKKHICKVCSKGFTMLCTLKEHMRTHTGEKPFLCSQCGKGFSQKTNLAQHTRRHQGLKPFKCESCEKRFVSKGELDAHSRKHSGAHPFVCDDCGNGFTTASALKKHRRIHTGEKPYLCDLCPMRFAASGTLKNHRRIHTGERPFQCSYCDKAFVQRNDLISHIRCHTGEKPYICSQCGQSFRKASGLKTHIKMHVKEPVSMLHGVNMMLSGMQCAEQ